MEKNVVKMQHYIDSQRAKIRDARNNLEAALTYASWGWPVFPVHECVGEKCSCGNSKCSSPGKHPRTPRGFKDATTDEGQIRSLWEEHPNANIGVFTGTTGGPFVLDIDPRHGGDASLAKLEKEYAPLPSTVTAITGGAGRHYLFRCPEDVKIPSRVGKEGSKLGPGLDIRAAGGYIVASPSNHKSGGVYAWDAEYHPDDIEIAHAPEWLLQLILLKNETQTGGFVGLSRLEPVINPELAKKRTLQAVASTVESTRNIHLYGSAKFLGGLLVSAGWDEQEIISSLVKAAIESGLTRDEALRTINNGLQKGKEAPLQISPRNGQVEYLEPLLEQLTLLAKDKPGSVVAEILRNKEWLHGLALVACDNPPRLEAFYMELRQLQVRVNDLDPLKKAIKTHTEGIQQARAKAAQEQAAEAESVLSRVPSAPVPADILVPKGWTLSPDGGVERIVKGKAGSGQVDQACNTPVLIVERLISVVDGNELTKVSWFRDGAWKEEIVKRSVISINREITVLADKGLPVTSQNAKALVDYLADFEKQNLDRLPITKSTPILGWQPGNEAFLWGKQCLVARPQGQEQPPTDQIHFLPPDVGDEQLADAFCSKGDEGKWFEAANQAMRFPLAGFAVYASLAAPFLAILEAANFIVDWAYVTSTGKTTILRLAASCWGSPNGSSGSSVMHSWDNTIVWIERAAATLHGLPLLLDDTKTAGTGVNRDNAGSKISQALYNISSGQGRGRGSITGLQQRGSWRTCMLTTGEQPATAYTQDGGTRGRVIGLWGPPFGPTDEATAQLVGVMNATIRSNYGHAGPRLIQYILDNQHQWPIWQQAYEENLAKYAEKSGGIPIAHRLSQYFATLATVVPIIHQALPELQLKQGDTAEDILEEVWTLAVKETEEADRALAALKETYDWAVANRDKFYKGQGDDGYEPHQGWAGVWKKDHWDYIGFVSKSLRERLKQAGYDETAIIRTWKDRGWLETSPQNNQKQCKIKGNPVRCYCVKKSALEEQLGLGEPVRELFVVQDDDELDVPGKPKGWS